MSLDNHDVEQFASAVESNSRTDQETIRSIRAHDQVAVEGDHVDKVISLESLEERKHHSEGSVQKKQKNVEFDSAPPSACLEESLISDRARNQPTVEGNKLDTTIREQKNDCSSRKD